MATVIRYRGLSDRRIITSADLVGAGFAPGGPIIWEQANGFEVEVEDLVAAWLLTEADFEPGDPGIIFTDLVVPIDGLVWGDIQAASLITTGSVLTGHDRYWWTGPDIAGLEGTAGYVGNGATENAPNYWAFDATTPEHIKLVWQPGDDWEAYTMRIAWMAPGAPTVPANVVWRLKQHRWDFNDSTVVAPATLQTTTPQTVTGALGTTWTYSEVGTAIPVTVGGLNESPFVLSVIQRVAADAGDTLNGDAGIFGISATRVDLP